MDVFAQMAEKIIESQETIIGPVALEQASHVPHLHLDWEHHEVQIDGNEAEVINDLVGVYRDLFGQVSVEVAKDAVARLIGQLGPGQLPEALK
jgi:hypothetical protein